MTHKDGGPDLHTRSHIGNNLGGSRRDFLKRSGAVGVGAVGLWAAPTVAAAAEIDGTEGSPASSTLSCFVGLQRPPFAGDENAIFYSDPTRRPRYSTTPTTATATDAEASESAFENTGIVSCPNSSNSVNTGDFGTILRSTLTYTLPADAGVLTMEYYWAEEDYTKTSSSSGGKTAGDVDITVTEGLVIYEAYGLVVETNVDGAVVDSWVVLQANSSSGTTAVSSAGQHLYAVELRVGEAPSE